MRLVAWNIQQGGGSRAGRIVQQIDKWQPDVIGLCEFQDSAVGRDLAASIEQLGLKYQASAIDAASRGINFVFIASKVPFEMRPYSGFLSNTGRWLHVALPETEIMLMHVPNASEKNRDKQCFLDEVVDACSTASTKNAVAIGDTNSGVPGVDAESGFFKPGCPEDKWFRRMAEIGWTDIWRERNPDGREYTWYSSKDNGFRLDQAFSPKSVTPAIKSIRYDWGEGGRSARLSDHAAIVVDMEPT